MNPFKPGDKVYHIRHGAGIAVQSSHQGTDYQWVQFSEIGIQDCHIGNLSFSPWPAPNHTRPFEAVLKKGETVVIRPNDGGVSFTITVVQEFRDSIQSGAESSWPKSRFTFHRIGEEIKFN